MAVTLDLTSILDGAGVENLKEGPKEVSGSCPAHLERLGHLDRHSSWSINKYSFLHHCFSCGYSGTLTGLLIDQLGSAPENLEEELTKAVLNRNWEKASNPVVIPQPVDPTPVVNDWSLVNMMKDVPQRLVDFRRLQRKAVDEYGVRWDPERKSWVLPIRSDTGSLLGAQFRQKGNELNLPEGLEKSVTLFGLCQMKRHDTVALVESPLDAVRMYGIGIPAVSSFGAWVSWEQCTLLARNFAYVILALDNDKPGRTAAAKVQQLLRRRGVGTAMFRYEGLVDVDGAPAKDPGDVADDTAIWTAWNRSLRMGL